MKYLLPFRRLRLAVPLALLAALPLTATAQTADRRTSVGLNVSVLQYKGEFGSDFWNFSNNNYAPGLIIGQYLGRGLDFNAQFNFGSLSGRRSATTYFNTDVVNANLGLKFKLNNGWALKEKSFIQPYLLAAPGWTYANRAGYYNGERIDLGKGYFDLFGAAGITFRLGEGAGLFVQSGLHMPMEANLDGDPTPNTERWQDQFLQHTVGLTFNLGQANDADDDGVPDRKDNCPNTPAGTPVDEYGCPPDRDQDGVPDYQDHCPDEAGTAELQGCADHDGDGVTDGDDACPDVAGKAELQGCPDADNDGVPDREDKCADTPADTQVDPSGCPVAGPEPTKPAEPATPAPSRPAAPGDADGDGVADAADRCPNSAGPASNKGCPVVKPAERRWVREATRYIGFEKNRAVLLPSSYATLDSVARLLGRYPDYSLSIAGHSDSKGPAAFNRRLSQERAAAARSYLLNKGIDEGKVVMRGYGPQYPVATNATEAGRARNRRVEFDLFLTGDPNPADKKYRAAKAAPAKAPVRKAAPAKAPVRKAAPAKKAAKSAAAKKPAPKAPARKPAAKAPAAGKAAPKAPAKRPAATPGI
jgi:outer membrane protein OmpA-like peptidoglycan-associated protein